jgi:DNA-directed RNA polymerase specialized sigma24 family protein
VAKAPKRNSVPAPESTTPQTVSLDRIAKSLALLVAKDRGNAESIVLLSQIGFSNPEIADLLQTTTGAVAQRLYEYRKAPKRRVKKPQAD